MDWLKRQRISQVLKYGWKDSFEIYKKENSAHRIKIFVDILKCFFQYNVFSNQYKAKELWKLLPREKKEICMFLGANNKKRDNWIRENYRNYKFIQKWSSKYWNTTSSRLNRRKAAYTKEFNAGTGLLVQHNVNVHRAHFLDGTISIGNNVILSKNIFIDYSGFVVIGDNVSISDGAIIESHSHTGYTLKGTKKPVQTPLLIENGASVGARAVILETCNRIGHYARIGAGTVVRQNIPPYALVIGNPARIVGFLRPPKDIELIEKDLPEEQRISKEEYTKLYNRYFKDRIKDNLRYTQL